MQCRATTNDGRRCHKLATERAIFCHIHADQADTTGVFGMFAGIAAALVIAPTTPAVLAGGAIGYVWEKLSEGKTMKKRVFVSFDFDNDRSLKDLIVGQSRNPDSPFEVTDYSLKEAAPEHNWEQKALGQIKRSEMVLVVAGPNTYRAPGVLKEVAMARREGKKIFQIVGYSDVNCPAVPNAGPRYRWTWENLKKLLS